MDGSSDYGHIPYKPFKLENPTYILPDLIMTEQLMDVKVEPGIVYDMVVSGDDTDEYNTDNKNINLRAGSDEDMLSLYKEETVDNNTVLPNTSSPDSGLQLSRNVIPSSLSECKVSSVHQYSKDSVEKMVFKKAKTSTVQSTGIQIRPLETMKKVMPSLQNEIFNNSKKCLRCNETKPNIYDTCHKCFSMTFTLKKRRNIQTLSKRYSCDTCHKSFRQVSDLKNHIRIHTGSKPYTCDACHISFSQSSALKRHIQIHTGNKPHTCDTCHKCFRRLSALKMHIRVHTGSKPYKCGTCHKCFSALSNLKTHNQIHTGSKPYTCDTCHKCFRTHSDLKKHIRIHTGIKPYLCNTCHKCFTNSSTLKTHIRTHKSN